LNAPWQFVYEAGILAALAILVTYCALPEPARQPVVMPVNSTIYRWNEIASALGHTGTQVAVQQPAGSFFLTDVERLWRKSSPVPSKAANRICRRCARLTEC